MDKIEVTFDQEAGSIAVWNNGRLFRVPLCDGERPALSRAADVPISNLFLFSPTYHTSSRPFCWFNFVSTQPLSPLLPHSGNGIPVAIHQEEGIYVCCVLMISQVV